MSEDETAGPISLEPAPPASAAATQTVPPRTSMMGREAMAQALGEAMRAAQQRGTSCVFFLATINNLAAIGEAFGFDATEDVIKIMGERLGQLARSGDAVARYSGATFGFILNNCDQVDLQGAAERFLTSIRDNVIETRRGPVWVLLSIGAVVLPGHAGEAPTAIALAEEALAQARQFPSDGFVIHQPSSGRTSSHSMDAHYAAEIVRCLSDNCFKFAFQPVVSAKTGDVACHEALLRMLGKDGEIIEAQQLIPIAEKLGLIRLIDQAVAQMAASTLQRHPEAKLTINISGATATDPRWFPRIVEILSANAKASKRLIVEITETAMLGNLTEAKRFLEQLRGLGCRIAIDDFGAGFTSYRNLRALPLDILKLDGSFCRNLRHDSDNRYFIRSLIDMAHAFGIDVVAEWVETEEDAMILRELQADYLQGNLFGKASLEAPWRALQNAEASMGALPFGRAKPAAGVAREFIMRRSQSAAAHGAATA